MDTRPKKPFRLIILCINTLCLLLGLIYLFNQKGSVFWNIYGFLMLAAFFGNIAAAYFEKEDRWLGYTYLVLSGISMIALPVINTVVSTIPSNHKSQSIISTALIFLLFILGGIITGKDYLRKPPSRRDVRGLGKAARNIIAALLSLALVSSIFIVFSVLKKDKSGILEVFVPEYALFYAIGYLSVGLLLLKLMDNILKSPYKSLLLAVVCLIFAACMLPFAATPLLLENAEREYTVAFGADYKDEAGFRSGLFRQVPFSLPEYFYGTPSGDYNLKENVIYYQGSQGVDKGLQLSFDVYTPPKDKGRLPGGNSVLIRIHGGGWTIGNKGSGNYAQVNKYFASQGYVVFDVQYGLADKPKLVKSYPVEATRVGNFNIDDMVRHIGIFTKYLAEHKDEYGANLDSVFISGGSAGGQLITAAGLGIASGNYTDMLDPEITIKGLIPFYPANGLPKNVGLSGRTELLDPTLLVSENSPPSLIYQGDHDGMVDPEIAHRFKTAYLQKDNAKCAVINMPFGSHASDFYFSGYYNQVFLYYMERFMYQYK